jgi:hypothetical protein
MVGGIPHEREVGDTLGSRVTPLRFDADAVVYGSANALLATEIALSRLYGDVSEQELNLLQLSASGMAQLGAGRPQIMRSKATKAEIVSLLFHHALSDPGSPTLTGSAHAAKQLAAAEFRPSNSLVPRRFDPIRHRHRSDVRLCRPDRLWPSVPLVAASARNRGPPTRACGVHSRATQRESRGPAFPLVCWRQVPARTVVPRPP